MKKTATSADDKRNREAQTKSYKDAEWIRVTFSNGRTRMLKRADYNALKERN